MKKNYVSILIFLLLDTDRARKHGMEEFIAADPVTANHHTLFSDLQKWSLDWRLKDPFASLVSKKNKSAELPTLPKAIKRKYNAFHLTGA